jgi:hypothetical protein
MQAITWMSALLKIAKKHSIYALIQDFDDSIGKHFYKYARGAAAPSIGTLNLIDQKYNMKKGCYPCASDVFNIGPMDGAGGYVPLWDALGGDVEKAWDVLMQFDSSINTMRHVGVPHEMKITRVVRHFPCAKKLHMRIWREDAQNVVAEAYRCDTEKLDMKFLAAIIAMWRVSMISGDGKFFMDYILVGLMEKAIPDVVHDYDIIPEFTQYLINLDTVYFNQFKALIANSQKIDPEDLQLLQWINELIKGRRLCEIIKPVVRVKPPRKKSIPKASQVALISG